MAVHLAAAGYAFGGGLFLCCPFSHEMSWMRSGTELIQFLSIFLPTHMLLGVSHGSVLSLSLILVY